MFIFRIILCVLFIGSMTYGAESFLPQEKTISLPFASDLNADRAYIDIPITNPLLIRQADSFEMDFECDQPDAIGNLTLYFRSGNGWYSYAVTPKEDFSVGTRQFHAEVLRSRNFHTEGTPEPLDKADVIRFSVWRGAPHNATIKLRNIQIVPYSILAVVSDSKEEFSYGNSLVARMNRAGIPTGAVSPNELTPERLTDCKIIVLPLNYKLPAETVAILQTFAEQGGKIVAFYQLPPELAKTLGFESGKYLKSPEDDSAFAKIRFEKSAPFEKFDEMIQKSWNIVTATPSTLYHAEIAAWWYDAASRKTEYPALLVSDRGAFFSHILTNEDSETKNRFLLTIFEHFDPAFRYRNIVRIWKSLFNIGDVRGRTEEQRLELEKKFLTELKHRNIDVTPEFFQTNPDETVLRKFVPKFQEFIDALQDIRQNAVREYCTTIPSKTPEFRAWWEHAGLGAYHGDWDRTMKELSETGFNAVISNLLWGGSAHYASDVIPRSKKFEQYGDQIEQAIQAGKKYGVEVHAWQVCYRLAGSPPEFIETMKNAGRLQKSFNGAVHDWDTNDWLCPSHSENIDLECQTFCELVRKYPDLAGIHFDYIRYPDENHCYCDGCRERFVKETGCDITNDITNWTKDVRGNGIHATKYQQWRCDNITKLVERVHRETKQIRSNIKISAAVFSNYPGCCRSIGQDWQVWVEKGCLDFICPMDYTENLKRFENLIKQQQELIGNRIPLYPGIGATATGINMTPDRVATEIKIVREQNLSGFVIFNLDNRTINAIPPMLKLGVTGKNQ
ncbi:MAG: family 10 glycosylhydrolase [Planctomycetaceae bacterium]|jgi:uncharacterized lipoprotein YddW (UPF0748 family)|nr:family 10 glycosylhydrolase [Planctomycetaceae bacterium]